MSESSGGRASSLVVERDRPPEESERRYAFCLGLPFPPDPESDVNMGHSGVITSNSLEKLLYFLHSDKHMVGNRFNRRLQEINLNM